MEKLNLADLSFILESLNYTKHKFENYPIGANGYPSYEYKQSRLDDVSKVIAKIQSIIKEAR